MVFKKKLISQGRDFRPSLILSKNDQATQQWCNKRSHTTVVFQNLQHFEQRSSQNVRQRNSSIYDLFTVNIVKILHPVLERSAINEFRNVVNFRTRLSYILERSVSRSTFILKHPLREYGTQILANVKDVHMYVKFKYGHQQNVKYNSIHYL